MTGEMAELFALGGEIARRMGIFHDIGAQALDDLYARGAERIDLIWIVCQQADGAYGEVLKYLHRQRVIAQIDFMAEIKICVDGVQSSFLKLVGFQFFKQADPSPLLLLVDKNACAFLDHPVQSKMQLIVAIAAQGMKDISGYALRMNADDGRRAVDVAQKQDHRGFRAWLARPGAVTAAFECQQAKAGTRGWELYVSNLAECHFCGPLSSRGISCVALRRN